MAIGSRGTKTGRRLRFAKDTVLMVDGTLVSTRDHQVAEQSENYRYSTDHQVVIDADTRLVVVVGRPLPGNRNDCKVWAESGAKARRRHVHDDRRRRLSGHQARDASPPPSRRGTTRLEASPQQVPQQVRARVEHVLARMKHWKILRDCRLKDDDVHDAVLDIAPMHNLTLAG